MTAMKEHLRLRKIKYLYEVKDALYSDFKIDINLGTGFSKSEYFHFVSYEGKKYVYKDALKFIYTNGDTYYLHEPLTEEFVQNPDKASREEVDGKIEKMFNFFRNDINNFRLFPEFIEETEKFFVFKYYDEGWEKLSYLTREDSKYIRKHFVWKYQNSKETITPFYNNMVHKLMRNKETGEIKMIDLKSLEFHQVPFLAIYMYSVITNDLYVLDWRFHSKEKLLKPFMLDYPAETARIIKHYVW